MKNYVKGENIQINFPILFEKQSHNVDCIENDFPNISEVKEKS